jgi:hypothetical protein
MAVGNGVYRWDGRDWSTQPTPNGPDELGGVACTKTKACTAVGSRVYTWNGRRWSSVQILRPPRGSDPELTGVSCPSRGACVAVGSYINGAGGVSLLVESVGIGAELGRRPDATARRMNIAAFAVLMYRAGAAVIARGVKAFLAL